MNTTTKVLIVINLVLALCLAYVQMTFFAVNENWRRHWDRDTTKLSEDLKVISSQVATATFNQRNAEAVLASTNAQLTDANSKIQTQADTILAKERELASANLVIANLQTDNASQREIITKLNESLKETRQRQNELNHIAQVARAVAFQLNVKLAEVEDDLNTAYATIQERETTIAKQEEEIKRQAALLGLVKRDYPQVWTYITTNVGSAGAGLVEGVVAAIRLDPGTGKQDLVMLTVGKDMKVEEGMTFTVFRGAQYIVKVRVERPMGDAAACRVIPESWNTKGLEIKPGDTARNRL